MAIIEIRAASSGAGIYTYSPDGTLLNGTSTPTFQGDPYLGWEGGNGRFTESSNAQAETSFKWELDRICLRLGGF